MEVRHGTKFHEKEVHLKDLRSVPCPQHAVIFIKFTMTHVDVAPGNNWSGYATAGSSFDLVTQGQPMTEPFIYDIAMVHETCMAWGDD